MSKAGDIATVFGAAFGVRLLLNTVFYLLYGWHSAYHVELWLYYGVATGEHVTGPGMSDPTVWIMRTLGSLLSGDALMYAIAFLAAALTAAAASIIYLIVSKVWGGRAALYAGLLYGFMVETLSLSVVGFTHDHLVTPLTLLGVYGIVSAVKDERLKNRFLWVLCAAAAFLLGARVHIGAYVGVGVAAVYLTGEMFRNYRHYRVLAALTLASMLLFGLCILPSFMEYQLGRLPQGRFGSADVTPVSAGDLWLRYNVLLLLLPWGVLAAYRRRENISLTYAVVGVIFAVIMDRGTRISDIGVAMLAAYALTSWHPRWNRRFMFYSGALLGVSTFLLPTPPVYRIIAGVAGLALVYLTVESEYRGALAVVLAAGVLLAAANFTVDTGSIVSEAEYRLYGRVPEGRVFAAWDRGYMVEALSDSDAVSTAGEIEYMAHRSLWLTERQAADILSDQGVAYILVSDRDFAVVSDGGLPQYRIDGGLVLEVAETPPLSAVEHTAAYRLAGGQPEYFTLVDSEEDRVLGRKYMMYRVDGGEGGLLSFAAVNHEAGSETAEVRVTVYERVDEKVVEGSVSPLAYLKPACIYETVLKIVAAAALIAAALGAYGMFKGGGWRPTALALLALVVSAALLYPTFQQVEQPSVEVTPPLETKHMVFNVTFPPGRSVHHLDVGELEEVYDCSVSLDGGMPWGYVGAVTFMNDCGSTQVAEVILVDSTVSAYAGEMMVEGRWGVELEPGETRTEGYSFSRRHPLHNYVVGFAKPECVLALEQGSRNPEPTGVETLHVFCPTTHHKPE